MADKVHNIKKKQILSLSCRSLKHKKKTLDATYRKQRAAVHLFKIGCTRKKTYENLQLSFNSHIKTLV